MAFCIQIIWVFLGTLWRIEQLSFFIWDFCEIAHHNIPVLIIICPTGIKISLFVFTHYTYVHIYNIYNGAQQLYQNGHVRINRCFMMCMLEGYYFTPFRGITSPRYLSLSILDTLSGRTITLKVDFFTLVLSVFLLSMLEVMGLSFSL